jgi:hypothetical protein
MLRTMTRNTKPNNVKVVFNAVTSMVMSVWLTLFPTTGAPRWAFKFSDLHGILNGIPSRMVFRVRFLPIGLVRRVLLFPYNPCFLCLFGVRRVVPSVFRSAPRSVPFMETFLLRSEFVLVLRAPLTRILSDFFGMAFSPSLRAFGFC